MKYLWEMWNQVKNIKKLLNFNLISIERNRLTLNFWFCKGMELGKFKPPPLQNDSCKV